MAGGRRIKREVSIKRAQKLSEVDFTKFSRIDLNDRIKHFYARVLTKLKKKAVNPEKHMNKIGYSDLIGKEREEKLAGFLPLLHLSNTQKLWLEQEKHLEEIWIYLHTYFNKNKDKFIEELEGDIEDMKSELAGELSEEFSESLVEEEQKIVQIKDRETDKQFQDDAEELVKLFSGVSGEIQSLDKEEKIEKITGFEEELE